jgi:hypothetical protein
MQQMNISGFDFDLVRVFDAVTAKRDLTRGARRAFLS